MKIERDLQDRRRKRKMEQIYPVAVIVNLFNLREQIFANSVNGTRSPFVDFTQTSLIPNFTSGEIFAHYSLRKFNLIGNRIH